MLNKMKLDMKNTNAIESSFVPNSCNSEEGLSFLIMLAFRFFFPWVYSCFLCKYSTTANSSIVPIRKNNETEIYIPRAVIFAVDGLWACWKMYCHMIRSYLSTHIYMIFITRPYIWYNDYLRYYQSRYWSLSGIV